MIQIKGVFNFDRAFQNFNIRSYSQEELEFFSLRCVKSFLLAVGMFQYSATTQKKEMGFSPKELGRIGEYCSQLVMGVNLVGGYENYVTILEEFLMTLYEMNTSENETSVRKDFKLSITSELRLMTANAMNKDNKYFI